VAVIDSIQTIYFPALTSAPGSVAQVRECTSALMQVAKREDITLLWDMLPKKARSRDQGTEHLVDTVLYFEEIALPVTAYCAQSKIASGTHEIGVFEMIDRGLREVSNPSELF